MKGFGLKVFPSGTKTFVVQYRSTENNRTKRRAIGKFNSPWSCKAARIEAARILHLVGLGQEPGPRASGDESQSETFKAFSDRFLSQYAVRNWAPRTIESHRSNVERWFVPILGNVPIGKITRLHVTQVLDQIEPNKPALPRNLFVLMRTMFNWAVDRGELEKSPMVGMRPPRPPAERHHILSDEEVIIVALAAFKMKPI